MSSGAGGRARRQGGSCRTEEGPVGVPFPEHSADLLGCLNQQRLSGLLCDVLLVSQEREFPAHRSVLASCSTYFHKLFTSGLAADRQTVYLLDFMQPEALAALLDFAYTATLTVSCSSVVDILSAARVLEVSAVQDVCTHLLDTKALLPQAGSEREDEEEEKREVIGREQGIRMRAREYLEFFRRGGHWGSSCSTPELRDLSPHPHFSQQNGADSNGPPAGPGDYNSPMTHEPATRDPKDNKVQEERQNGSLPSAQRKPSEAVMSFYAPTQNGHFYLRQAEPKPEREAEGVEERERGPASALLQQMMDCLEQKQVMAGGGVVKEDRLENEEPDMEFYLKYLNSLQQEDVTGAHISPGLLPLLSMRGSRGGTQTAGGGNSGEKKMRSKSFQRCPICFKVIQGAGKLPRHIRTHTGEKPYECSICNVRFTRQDKLKVHMRKHTGEKPYLCSQCGAAFTHNYDLKNHMRVHTGLRPYQCSTCFKTFVRSDHLHRHLKKDGCNGIPSRRGRKPRTRDPELPEDSLDQHRPDQREPQGPDRDLSHGGSPVPDGEDLSSGKELHNYMNQT